MCYFRIITKNAYDTNNQQNILFKEEKKEYVSHRLPVAHKNHSIVIAMNFSRKKSFFPFFCMAH